MVATRVRQASTLPEIQYAPTRDGARIAFYTLGRGPGVLMLFPYHVNHLALNWQVGLHREGMQFLARFFTVISLDFRGAGLSTRAVDEISWETFVLDIEAVLDTIDLERVSLCAMGPGALVACQFARQAPRRVVRIVTICAGDSELNRSVLGLRRINQRAEAQARSALLVGTEPLQDVAALAAVAREALDPDVLGRWERLYGEASAPVFAKAVESPTLCLHARNDDFIPIPAGRAFADSLPRSTFTLVDAKTGMHVWRQPSALHAMASFFLEGFDLNPLPSKRGAQVQPAHPAGLTAREAAVLRLVAAGYTNRQIAADLSISLHTVSHHLRSIFAKTSSANRTEAAAFAHRHLLG